MIILKTKLYFLIKKIQNYLKIDLFYLLKNEFWLMTGKIITASASFLLALAWANLIQPEIYGHWQYLLSLVEIISILALPGLGTALVQAVARGLEGSLEEVFWTKLKWGFLGSLVFLVLAGWNYFQGKVYLVFPFLFLALFLPWFRAFQIYLDFLAGRKLFSLQVRYNVLVHIVSVALMILTLFILSALSVSLGLTLSILVLIYFLPRIFFHLYFYLRIKKTISPKVSKDYQVISFGKHLTLAGFLGTLANNLDRLLLFHYLGPVQVAVYSFALILPKQISVFFKHLGALALPKFALRTKEELKKTLLKKIFYLASFISGVVLVYFFLAPYLYNWFFPQYRESIFYSRLYAFSLIPLCFSLISVVFEAKLMKKEIYQVKIIVSFFRSLLFLVLIPHLGLLGAILSIFFARTFSALFLLFLFQRIT